MESVMEVVNWTLGNMDTILTGVLSIVGGFSILAALTPNTADDAIVQKVLNVINFLGANVKNAKKV